MSPHERLRMLREGRSFGSQKAFCNHAQKYGYSISSRRYGAIERGDVKPDIDEIIDICEAMKISSDAWLFGAESRVDLRGLSEERIGIVAEVAKMLFKLD
jgi:predicted nucleotidyltransferase